LNVGTALYYLDERQADEGLLNDAMSEFRSVLLKWPREQVPRLWVKAQINIGRTLIRLGEREIGTESLREAKDALRAALEICSPEFSTLSWAVIHNYLGI
jgi:hypothetical protein